MRRLLVPVLAVALLIAAVPCAAADGAGSVTVILVRHAETAGDTHGGGDPALSPAGEARARALARALGDVSITHLFSSEYERTRSTLGPLSRVTGLDVSVVAAGSPDEQASALRALPAGSVAVVAGHSNTVPAIAALLGGRMTRLESHERHGALIPHEEYDRMVIVVVGDDGAAPTVELRYGS